MNNKGGKIVERYMFNSLYKQYKIEILRTGSRWALIYHLDFFGVFNNFYGF
jgi:hypothetical protein